MDYFVLSCLIWVRVTEFFLNSEVTDNWTGVLDARLHKTLVGLDSVHRWANLTLSLIRPLNSDTAPIRNEFVIWPLGKLPTRALLVRYLATPRHFSVTAELLFYCNKRTHLTYRKTDRVAGVTWLYLVTWQDLWSWQWCRWFLFSLCWAFCLSASAGRGFANS